MHLFFMNTEMDYLVIENFFYSKKIKKQNKKINLIMIDKNKIQIEKNCFYQQLSFYFFY